MVKVIYSVNEIIVVEDFRGEIFSEENSKNEILSFFPMVGSK